MESRRRALGPPSWRSRPTVATLPLPARGERRICTSTICTTRVRASALKDLTPLPCTPPFVLGIVNVRGRIVPVFDLKKFFDLPDQGLTDLHRIILIEGNEMELGLLADVTVGVRSIPADSLQPSLSTFTGIRSEYLKGVTAERLVVLDVARILADPKIIVHEEVET